MALRISSMVGSAFAMPFSMALYISSIISYISSLVSPSTMAARFRFFFLAVMARMHDPD